MFQPGVGNIRAIELQPFELGQAFEVFQPSVRNCTVLYVQHFELRKAFEMFQFVVCKLNHYRL